MTQRTLLGMITPSSNTILEPYTTRILDELGETVSAHFQRFQVTEISMEQDALQQFNLPAMVDAARMLHHARVHAIAWNGTAASWLGFEVDEALCQAIEEATGVPATTTILALNEFFALNQIRRFALVTPYIPSVQQKIIENYRQAGFDVAAEEHLSEQDNYSFSEFDEELIASMIRRCAIKKPEAIVILCTNFKGAEIAAQLEAELKIPIIDSVSITVWKALLLAGEDPRKIKQWGQLFHCYPHD